MVRGEPEIQFAPPPQLDSQNLLMLLLLLSHSYTPNPCSKGRPPSWLKIKHQLVQLYQTLS